MNENQRLSAVGRARPAFAATPNYKQKERLVQDNAPASDAAQQSLLQDDAAMMKPAAGALQVDTGASQSPTQTEVHSYMVSVDEIRERLQTLGITKSKDTIQRYCREGLLEAERLGLMRRYYATETSVEALLEKLQQDAGASNSTQVHEIASDELSHDAQVHAGKDTKDIKQNNDPDAGANIRTQVLAGEHTNTTKVAGVERELRNQIGDLKGEIEFLRDELVDRREQAKALQDVIAGMRDQSKANLLNAETQAQSRNEVDPGTSYTASVFKDETAETQEAEEGDNQQSTSNSNGV